MVTDPEFIEHIRSESARFAVCASRAQAADPVPTCPEWTADDLLWHLTEVQLFWAVIVRERLSEPDAADAVKPERPTETAASLALFATATTALLDALTSTPRDTELWTWSADHHARFVTRWQAHEALMHRLDAELTIGEPTAIDRALASDGIDVILRVNYADLPEWATFTPDGTSGRIETRDANARWTVELGRFTGTSPNTGNDYDMESLIVVDEPVATPSFTLRGGAADLDAWLWGRGPIDTIEIDGARDAFARLEQIVAKGAQ